MRAVLGVLFFMLAACGAAYDPMLADGELPPAGPDARLTARFFGVSTILLSDGRSGIMSDGFFSRPRLLQAVAPLKPDEGAIGRALERGKVGRGTVRAVLVAHSHYDHALDSATVATKLDAEIVGSASTCRIARAENFPRDRTRLVEGGELLDFDPFRVRVFRSRHTPPPPPPIPPLSGEIAADFHVPARITAYEEGGTYSFLIEHGGRTFLIHSSTNFVPGLYAGVRADVVFLGVALLGRQGESFARDYWNEVVVATGARLVVPVHWDDFTRPLDAPLEFLGWPDDVAKSMALVRPLAQATGVTVKFMPLFEPVDMLKAARIDAAARNALPPPTVVRRPPTCPL